MPITWTDVKQKTAAKTMSAFDRGTGDFIGQDSGILNKPVSPDLNRPVLRGQDVIRKYYDQAERSTSKITNGLFNTANAMAAKDGVDLGSLFQNPGQEINNTFSTPNPARSREQDSADSAVFVRSQKYIDRFPEWKEINNQVVVPAMRNAAPGYLRSIGR